MNETMNQNKNPDWWTDKQETAWNHVKTAIKRDWKGNKNDVAGSRADTLLPVENSAQQASGNSVVPLLGQPTYDELEPAYRFGYGAHSKYSGEYPDWDDGLELCLIEDWRVMQPARKVKWEQDRAAIRYGWDYASSDFKARK
jgi:hypothetical protein